MRRILSCSLVLGALAHPRVADADPSANTLLGTTGGSPAISPSSAAPDVVDVPRRTLILQDPPIGPELTGTEIMVLSTGGSYYQGRVLSTGDGRIAFSDGSRTHRFEKGGIRRLNTVEPARPPVDRGDEVTILTRNDGTRTGTVTEVRGRYVVIETAAGASIRVNWYDIVQIDIDAVRRPVDIADIEELGIKPVPIHQPQPRYPPEARRASLSGVVVLEIVVGRTGRVETAKVVRSSPTFDAAALETVRTWQYQPLVLEGKPSSWRSKVTLQFNLRD